MQLLHTFLIMTFIGYDKTGPSPPYAHSCLNAFIYMIECRQTAVFTHKHAHLVMCFTSLRNNGPCHPNTHCRPNAFIYMTKCRPNAAIIRTPGHDFHNLHK